jgi:hypothetical protein
VTDENELAAFGFQLAADCCWQVSYVKDSLSVQSASI